MKTFHKNKNKKIVIIDVGARYGIHPSFKRIADKAKYIGFDPDKKEIERLQKKYKKFKNVSFYHNAVGNHEKKVKLTICKHKGQSSLLKANRNTYWNLFARKREMKRVSVATTQVITLRKFTQRYNVKCDFLKIDTEGNDLSVLQGCGDSLDEIVGIQCEAQFESSHLQGSVFWQIQKFLTARGFFLLNFAYDGKGTPLTYFYQGDRCGALLGTDAAYLKKFEILKNLSIEKQLKAALYCFIHHSPDVALFILKRFRLRNQKKQEYLFSILEKLFLETAISLKNSNPLLFLKSRADFLSIFKKPFPDLHKYYESNKYNPA